MTGSPHAIAFDQVGLTASDGRAILDHIDLEVATGSTTALLGRSVQDDKHYSPPYQAIPLVRQEALDRWPQQRRAFADSGAKITAEEMQTMNDAVDGEHRDPAQVVREFRQAHGP